MFGVDEPPPRLGRYRVEERIGAGAMGTVYRAWDESLQRHVALKLVRTSADSGARGVLREARALAALTHPNVVTVHEVGEAEGRTFLAMELIAGLDLRRWLTTARSTSERLRVLTEIARGIAAAHAAGLLHRDIKPENVLVGDDGRVRVVDFGLVTTPGQADHLADETNRVALSGRTTATGHVVGTPAYMAPEVVAGGEATVAADQFALCCVAWELLAGVHPFPDPAARDGAPVGARPSDVPRAVWVAIERGLAELPGDRLASVADLAATLEAAARPPRVALVAIGGVLAGALLVSALALATREEPNAVEKQSAPGAIEWSLSTYCRDVKSSQASVTALPGLLFAAACTVAAPDTAPTDAQVPEATDASSVAASEECVAAIDSEPIDNRKLEMMGELLWATSPDDPGRPAIHFEMAKGELLGGATDKGCTHLVLATDQAKAELADEARVVHEACCADERASDLAAARPEASGSGCTHEDDAERVCRDGTETACCINASVGPRVRWAQARKAEDEEAAAAAKAAVDELLGIGCQAGHAEACDALRNLE